MAILEMECPVCGEVLEFTGEDRAELQPGDVIACGNCETELEVTVNDGQNFELEPLGALTICPSCGEELDVTEELLQGEDAPITCPHCKTTFVLDLSE